MPAKRKPGRPIPLRSGAHPDRRCVHINLTAWEYRTISERAAAAGLSLPRYFRRAAMGVPILGTKPGTDVLSHVRNAIACVRALAHTTLITVNPEIRLHLEPAIAKLYDRGAKLAYHSDHIEAAPSEPESPRSQATQLVTGSLPR